MNIVWNIRTEMKKGGGGEFKEKERKGIIKGGKSKSLRNQGYGEGGNKLILY